MKASDWLYLYHVIYGVRYRTFSRFERSLQRRFMDKISHYVGFQLQEGLWLDDSGHVIECKPETKFLKLLTNREKMIEMYRMVAKK